MSMKPNESSSCSDFGEDEWTPQDSAYGAACPICGWIPKRTRQTIEMILILILMVLVIYGVITVSVHITELHRQGKSNSGDSTNDGSKVDRDDDFYVSTNSADVYGSNGY